MLHRVEANDVAKRLKQLAAGFVSQLDCYTTDSSREAATHVDLYRRFAAAIDIGGVACDFGLKRATNRLSGFAAMKSGNASRGSG